MKRLLLAVLLALSTTTGAYNIGGAYAQLISCTWGQFGYQYGYLGTYSVNGQIYTMFFGANYCAY